jgi:hypothetical protein
MEICKELYEAYIEPVVSGTAPSVEFPRYHWIQHLDKQHSKYLRVGKEQTKASNQGRCAVVEFTSSHKSRRITASWSKKDKGFKGMSGEVVDGARRRIPAATANKEFLFQE